MDKEYLCFGVGILVLFFVVIVGMIVLFKNAGWIG